MIEPGSSLLSNPYLQKVDKNSSIDLHCTKEINDDDEVSPCYTLLEWWVQLYSPLDSLDLTPHLFTSGVLGKDVERSRKVDILGRYIAWVSPTGLEPIWHLFPWPYKTGRHCSNLEVIWYHCNDEGPICCLPGLPSTAHRGVPFTRLSSPSMYCT